MCTFEYEYVLCYGELHWPIPVEKVQVTDCDIFDTKLKNLKPVISE